PRPDVHDRRDLPARRHRRRHSPHWPPAQSAPRPEPRGSGTRQGPASPGVLAMTAILEILGVNKRFAGLRALADVNLSVREGSVHAIIGPNGAGKSTLLNCLVGRLVPDSGSVTFDGHSLLGMAPHRINQSGVSRVFQTPEIFADLSLLENAMIPAFARRDGAFRLNAWGPAIGEEDIHEKA